MYLDKHKEQVKESTGTIQRYSLPSEIALGVQQLSGIDVSNTHVERNSSKPAALGAHSFAQGENIHIGPGREQDLAHEAWHVVQQKEGRVQPTTTIAGEAVNTSETLEKEADIMGERAINIGQGLLSE